MNEQITVKELAAELNKLVKNGLGDRKIVLSDDSEGNGYHGMYYLVTYEKEDLEPLVDDIYDSATKDPKKIVIIG